MTTIKQKPLRQQLLGFTAAALLLPLGTGANTGATEAVKEKESAGQAESWDVNQPPYEFKPIALDTRETTWSNLDVSPDGRTILFDMLGDIYQVPVSGGKAKALTNELAWNMQPRFSPDGQSIVFISDRDGADNIWVMDRNGDKLRQLTTEKENLVHSPSWSPDGQHLVARKGFMSGRSIPAGEIWMYHYGGGEGRQLKERLGGEIAQKNIADPVFSPDGRYIYYSIDTTPGTVWEYNKNSTQQIFAINRYDLQDGKEETFVSGPGGAIAPMPSPDGNQLAFIRRQDNKTSLFLKDLETGLETPVYSELERDLQETFGSHGNYVQYDWMPDGESLIVWSKGKFQRIAADGSGSEEIAAHIQVEKQVADAVRFPVDVAPEEFQVKMIRWAQKSPDGRQIAFQALGRIYIQDVESGERRRLTRQDDHFEFYPSWSRDGRQITYVTWDDEKLGHVRVVSARSGRGENITSQPGLYVEPSFSPSGETVAYRRFTGGYLLSPEYSLEPGIYLADADGDWQRRIAKAGYEPHFGADDERIYFSEFVYDGGGKRVLKSVDANGKDEREHLHGAEITSFRLSPDGRWVAFTQDFKAYVAPFMHTGKSESIGPNAKAVAVKQVSARAGEHLHWSADSRTLGWSHGPKLYEQQLRNAFDFVAGAPEALPEPVAEGVDLSFVQKHENHDRLVALTGGKVVTMRDAEQSREVIDNGVVLFRGNRIVAVGPANEVEIPLGAKRIDVSGKTVLPGLIDAHAHGAQGREEIIPQQNWNLFSSLAFGVTTIHDPSNDSSEIFSAAEMQKAGLITGPRIFSTGTILYGAKGPGYKAKINSLEDAQFHVGRLKEMGAISVKSYNQPRREQRQQVLQAAREQGIMVVPEGGGKFQHNMNMIVDGHTGVEHSLPIANVYTDVEQLWGQTQVGYTPTFVVAYGGLSGEYYWYDRTEVWKNERLTTFTPDFIVNPRSIRRPTAPDSHYNHFNVARHAKQLRDKGVTVHIGAHGQREGLGAHWELWMMGQGGFTPWEAFRAGTIDGARYLGMDGDLGSIEPGKLADLIVVDGNPLEDLRQSENIAYTVINGRIFDASTMNELDSEDRLAFFHERLPISAMPTPTAEAIQEKMERHHWVH
ncbi:translocation protein TolB [Microbulbifer aggregans]|uniref:Translocation protein TolB n=1 Tax=Microbulbifer aggregans TaxID=1769779 RepID=A0A1C9W5C8_9GAMM|nr:amidohydrolase family protein [Microbulbifer aggregans]AOS96349.1 translocation protein TolB [Microbulbifer aggregans]